jgi:uncharacterized protein
MNMPVTPFHPGELEAQQRAGIEAPPRGAAIRDFMPDQHREFFAQLPFLVVATEGREGWPAATLLAGPPGFVSSPDCRTLRIAAAPQAADPASSLLVPGAPIGVLGIEPPTRRRNRTNGRIALADREGITIAVEQSFGNCPQYIQTREVRFAAVTEPCWIEPLEGLDSRAAELIAAQDTFFVASSAGPRSETNGGVDVSHRGGRPGFVRVDGDELTIPDFRGNRYFNTLGNLLKEPRAAFLFVDFERGDLLHLQGRAEILWDASEAQSGFTGAERLWRLRVDRGFRLRNALPLRWTFGDYAPTTAQTGTWAEAAAKNVSP